MEIDISDKLTKAFQDFFHKTTSQLNEIKNEVFVAFQRDHELIGRVLKCHLLVETYLGKAIEYYNKDQLAIEEIKLTFFSKLQLLESKMDEQKTYFKGIRELNKIRNKLAHDLNTIITIEDVKEMKPFAEIYERKKIDSPIIIIEKFSLVACALLKNQINENFGDLSKLFGFLVKQLNENSVQYEQYFVEIE